MLNRRVDLHAIDATVLRERAVNFDLYTRRSRYPDLHAKFCATGRCDTHALHDHYKNEGLTEKRRWGCGSRIDELPPTTGQLPRRKPSLPVVQNASAARASHPFRVAVCFWGVHLCARSSCHDSRVRSLNLISAQA